MIERRKYYWVGRYTDIAPISSWTQYLILDKNIKLMEGATVLKCRCILAVNF